MLDHISLFGIQVSAYSFFNTAGFFLLLTFNLFQRGKVFLGLKNDFSATGSKEKTSFRVSRSWGGIFVLSCVQCFSGVIMNKVIGRLFTGGNDNYFGFAIFAPYIFILFCKLVKTDAIGYLDAFTPAYALSLFSFKIACFCAGCCRGVNVGPVLYYPAVDRFQFPIQLVESLTALLIFFFLLNYRKKAHRGTMHAMYLILYSSTRFFTEFMRAEKDIFWLFKMYHVWCLTGIFVGTAEFFIFKKICSVKTCEK